MDKVKSIINKCTYFLPFAEHKLRKNFQFPSILCPDQLDFSHVNLRCTLPNKNHSETHDIQPYLSVTRSVVFSKLCSST